jgi:hypothetical protein
MTERRLARSPTAKVVLIAVLMGGTALALWATLPHRPRPEEGTAPCHLETWLTQARDRDPIPRFVERDLRKYLDCGILARVHASDADPPETPPTHRDRPPQLNASAPARPARTTIHCLLTTRIEIPILFWDNNFGPDYIVRTDLAGME